MQVQLHFEGVDVEVELLLSKQLRLLVRRVPHVARQVHQDGQTCCFLQTERLLAAL